MAPPADALPSRVRGRDESAAADERMTQTTTPTAWAAGARRRPAWADAMDPYARPSRPRAILDLATSIVPYVALSVAMYFALSVSYWLVLALAIPASG